jgi:transposase
MAIDEICIGSAHRHLTIVIDWASGAVLFVGEGKSADSLAPFWRRLKRSRAHIEAVAIDMSKAYILLSKPTFPTRRSSSITSMWSN